VGSVGPDCVEHDEQARRADRAGRAAGRQRQHSGDRRHRGPGLFATIFARSISSEHIELPGMPFLVSAALLVVGIGIVALVVRRQKVPEPPVATPAVIAPG